MKNYRNMISKWPLHWALGGDCLTGGLEQNHYELEKLCEFIDDHKIKTYTEIGIAAGYLLKFMMTEMELDVFGITLEERDTHVGLPLVYGLSQDPTIISQSRKSDMYFVDGDHSYEAVKSDYENSRDKCRYMAFHDILGLRDCEGVSRLWNEIKNNYQHWQFIDSNISHASGIGIIKIK